MPEIISYHDKEKNIINTLDTFGGLGIRRIANILTVMVVLLALPVTLIAVRQANTLKQRASGSVISISEGLLTTSQSPWVISLKGKNFNPLMKARMYDGEKQWGNDITVIFENANKLSVQLPTTQPPSECVIGQSCTFSLQLIDPNSSFLSNKIKLVIN